MKFSLVCFGLKNMENVALKTHLIQQMSRSRAALIWELVLRLRLSNRNAVQNIRQGCHLADLTAKFLDSGCFLKPLAVKD